MGEKMRERNVWNQNAEEAATQGRNGTTEETGGEAGDMGGSSVETSKSGSGQVSATLDPRNMEGSVPDGIRQPQKEELTAREAECLDTFVAERSMVKAAAILGMRADTLKKTLRRIREKLGVETNAGFFAEGVEYDRRENGETVGPAALLELIETQEYRCALSGVELTPDTAALDHIVPRADGGEHVLSNVQWLHGDVNRAKGTLSNEEFVKLCRRVAGWTS
jgi:DNA-binding CsgD family transcriptional regulator